MNADFYEELPRPFSLCHAENADLPVWNANLGLLRILLDSFCASVFGGSARLRSSALNSGSGAARCRFLLDLCYGTAVFCFSRAL